MLKLVVVLWLVSGTFVALLLLGAWRLSRYLLGKVFR